MDIGTYLRREAEAITASSLAHITTPAAWATERPARHALLLDRLGIAELVRDAPRATATCTGVVARDGYRIERILIESLPRLYVTANAYIPTGLAAPAPAVLYLCGHAPGQKAHYQAHARRFCRLGFVCLIVDTIQLGEIRGEHHGTWSGGRFHWLSRGYSPTAVEVWNAIGAIDLLARRADVDAGRIGLTGISGGGMIGWYVAAVDERVRMLAPVCATGTAASHVHDLTIDGQCDCLFHLGADGWDFTDVYALVAPRPLLVCATEGDEVFAVAGARAAVDRLRRIYALYGAGDRCAYLETPGPHGYHERSRAAIFAAFASELLGRAADPATIGDIDPSADEPASTLVVLEAPPPDERTSVIDDDFIPRPAVAAPTDVAALAIRRDQVVAELRTRSFGSFPREPAPLDLDPHFPHETRDARCVRFRFTGEPGWRLSGELSIRSALARPAGVIVAVGASAGEPWRTDPWLAGVEDRWGLCRVEVRGTGRAGWSAELSWHVRRAAAMLGRTVASMRTYDLLRAIRAVRRLDGVDPAGIVLAARGEMVPVALCAALLDGAVAGLLLADAPPTLDAAGTADGRGPAAELIGALRVIDLPELAALCWPAELVFVGRRDPSYRLSEEAYAVAAGPGVVRHVRHAGDWQGRPRSSCSSRDTGA